MKFKHTKLINWCIYRWKQLRGTLTKTDIAVHYAILNNKEIIELPVAEVEPSDYIGILKRK